MALTLTYQPIFNTLVRIDTDADGPPWPMLLWNPASHAWEAVGFPPAAEIVWDLEGHLVLDMDGDLVTTGV